MRKNIPHTSHYLIQYQQHRNATIGGAGTENSASYSRINLFTNEVYVVLAF